MKTQSPSGLIIKDFLQYIPKPKRRDYELMLLRCNFSDPGDPLFPIILFLLFLQDSLSDRSDTLTDEFCKLRTVLETGQPLPERPHKLQWWKVTALSLLIFQVIMGVLGLYQINMIAAVNVREIQGESRSSSSLEIQKINRYWDKKIENIKDPKTIMNESKILPDELIGVVVTVTVIFVVLLLLQITLTIVTVSKLCKSEEEFKDLEQNFKSIVQKSGSYDETGSYIDRFYDPGETIIEDDLPDIPEPDTSGWGEVEVEGETKH